MDQAKPPTDDFRETPEYRATDDFLRGRINYERVAKMPYSNRDMNLDRMRRLLALLGDPHKSLNIIHIAGTKGKGSTAAFISSALQAEGLRCGSYTSPHLHHIEERFRLNGEPCDPRTLVKLVQAIQPAVKQLDAEHSEDLVTYFEIATALGFLFFVNEEVDVAVLEVGLGGRLDSTNVCEPLVSVITSISLDHTKQLGDTLALIAAEKAGIIKEKVPVISGVSGTEAKSVIEKIAVDRNAPLVARNLDFRFENYQFKRNTTRAVFDIRAQQNGKWTRKLSGLEIGALGEHQAANASVAWAALNKLPKRLQPNDEAIRKGFATVQCDARIEIVATEPMVVIDAAHNVASSKALVETLSEFEAARRWLILGTTRGKDVAGMLDYLIPHFDRIVCTRYENNPRGHAVETLSELIEEKSQLLPSSQRADRVDSHPIPLDAWRAVERESEPDDLICITGSFFLAAELRSIFRP